MRRTGVSLQGLADILYLVAHGPASLTFWFFYEKAFIRFLRNLAPVRHTFFWQKGARISEYETLNAVIIANMDLSPKNFLDPNSP